MRRSCDHVGCTRKACRHSSARNDVTRAEVRRPSPCASCRRGPRPCLVSDACAGETQRRCDLVVGCLCTPGPSASRLHRRCRRRRASLCASLRHGQLQLRVWRRQHLLVRVPTSPGFASPAPVPAPYGGRAVRPLTSPTAPPRSPGGTRSPERARRRTRLRRLLALCRRAAPGSGWTPPPGSPPGRSRRCTRGVSLQTRLTAGGRTSTTP